MVADRAIETAATTLSSTLAHSRTCDDIHNCRTISSIIYSCASTVFLCTWVAFHPDVRRNVQEAWWKRLLTRFGFMMGALLAPEVVLLWAMHQWADGCGDLRKRLEAYPTCTWTETHAMLAGMNGLELVKSEDNRERVTELASLPPDVDISMPSEEQIMDRSKRDNISKAIALTQTVWFAVQAAHRVSQGLDVTELELTTLGHVVLTVFIYFFWWNKPLNIRFPIELRAIKKDDKQDVQTSSSGAESEDRKDVPLVAPIEMAQNARLSLRVRICIFSADAWYRWKFRWVSVIIVTGLFGAVHCLAWNSTFPTHKEQVLWRVCALIVTAAPGLAFILVIGIDDARLEDIAASFHTFALIPTYVFARICLLVLAFIALRDLPYSALETPSWSIFIPHIA